jgi:hypothetical protein
MSAMLNTPEPPPIKTEGPAIWPLVVADVTSRLPAGLIRDRFVAFAEARDRLGRAKYGTSLQAHNGRNPLADAIQESGDKIAYLAQAVEEGYPVAEYYRREIADCMSLIAIHEQFKPAGGR